MLNRTYAQKKINKNSFLNGKIWIPYYHNSAAQ